MAERAFIQAANYTPTNGRRVDLVVVHTMEAPEKGTTAESCAHYFAGTYGKAPRASAHYCIDNDSIVQGVLENDVAWAAPGANNNGIQLEHAGYARQEPADWADPYSEQMLRRSAALVAEVVVRHNIPVVWLEPHDLLAGRRGITSHWNVSKAFKRSDHWDPGHHFPVPRYLTLVKEFIAGKPPAPYNPQPELPRDPAQGFVSLGSTGKGVRDLQTDLNKLGYGLAVDGDFGPATLAAVKDFQRKQGLQVDGVVGPNTLAAIGKAITAAQKPKEPPVGPIRPTLRKGDEGAVVRELQEYLKKLGAKIVVDGDFGPKTEDAVKAFQRFWMGEGAVDGVVGPKTWHSIFSVNHLAEYNKTNPTIPASLTSKLLKRGSKGEDVRELQKVMNMIAGRKAVVADGDFGPKTEDAVKQLQRFWLGPNQDDGIVGPKTWKLLNDLLSAKV